MDKEQQEFILKIIDKYWSDFKEKETLPGVVTNSIPIVWFGNIEEYFKSEIKTITVGLNPSCSEFTDDSKCSNVNYRFRDCSNLASMDNLNSFEKNNLISNLNDYFTYNPYNKWFNFYDSKCMQFIADADGGYDVGYKDHNNTAIHVDCFSAIATDPTWNKLVRKEKYLNTAHSIKNVELFIELVKALDPDVILFSKDFATFKDCMTRLYELNADTPSIVVGNGKEDLLRGFCIDGRLIIHGRYNGQPFAPISDDLKTAFFKELFNRYAWDRSEKKWRSIC